MSLEQRPGHTRRPSLTFSLGVTYKHKETGSVGVTALPQKEVKYRGVGRIYMRWTYMEGNRNYTVDAVSVRAGCPTKSRGTIRYQDQPSTLVARSEERLGE